MSRDFTTDRDAATRRYQEWARRNRNRLDDILNDDQMRTWQETIGDPYEFPADVYFPNELPSGRKIPINDLPRNN